MFNAVSFVRELCKERGLPIATVEKACGFGNGYLNPKKISTLSYERAVVLANYLNLTAEYLLTGEEEQKEKPASIVESELDETLKELFEIANEVDEADRQLLLDMARSIKKRRES